MKKIISIVMLLVLMAPICSLAMHRQNSDDNQEITESVPSRLEQMRAMQERAHRLAQRLTQGNPQEQQFEYECPVCREAEATIQLPCNHRLCKTCLENWATIQEVPSLIEIRMHRELGQQRHATNTCPTCRANIPDAFIRQELVDSISPIKKAQLRISLLCDGFIGGLFFGSIFKKTINWWRSPYIEKTASMGNEIFNLIISWPTYWATDGQLLVRELEMQHNFDQNIINEDTIKIFLKHMKIYFVMNRIMSTGLMLKTKNRSLIRNSLHTNLLFPSLYCAREIIPPLNKGYPYRLAKRTAPKAWNIAGTCLGLYYTNKIYNTYNEWGSRMLKRAGIAV